MITSTEFGTNGRLGNNLFQYASMIGLSRKYNKTLLLPKWKYAEYFDHPYPEGNISGLRVKEPTFHHDANFWDCLEHLEDVDISGYLQSAEFWASNEAAVKATFRFKKDFISQTAMKFADDSPFEKAVIAVSVRRGDYVDNPNYIQLGINYYINALEKNFPNWRTKYNLLLFSDDIPYCKVHFGCLDNAYFAEGNSDIEDMCLMSQCQHYIIANSSYSWWGAYLGTNKHKVVVRPNGLFAGDLAKANNSKDFYYWDWKTQDVDERIHLEDTAFTIPVKYDHNDRLENFDLCIKHLNKYFRTFIIVGEQIKGDGTGQARFLAKDHEFNYAGFIQPEFHRTYFLNQMAESAPTTYVANWDTDILVPPIQILEAVRKLREGADMVYPYDGRFARMSRHNWLEKLQHHNDIGVVGDTQFNGMGVSDATSVGGAVLFNKKSFKEGGRENEKFISFGAEDMERFVRFSKLGFKVERISGVLYHLDHYIGVDSSKANPHFKANEEEFQKVYQMSKQELKDYIKTW